MMSNDFYKISPFLTKLSIYLNLRDVISDNMRMNAISGRSDEQRMHNYGRTNWKIIGIDEIWIVIFIQENGHLQNKNQLFHHNYFLFYDKICGFFLDLMLTAHSHDRYLRGLTKYVIISIQSLSTIESHSFA